MCAKVRIFFGRNWKKKDVFGKKWEVLEQIYFITAQGRSHSLPTGYSARCVLGSATRLSTRRASLWLPHHTANKWA